MLLVRRIQCSLRAQPIGDGRPLATSLNTRQSPVGTFVRVVHSTTWARVLQLVVSAPQGRKGDQMRRRSFRGRRGRGRISRRRAVSRKMSRRRSRAGKLRIGYRM